MVYFGKLSYPIYLWHWPLIVIAKMALGSTDLPTAVVITVIALTIFLSTVTFKMESPIRKWRPERLAFVYVAFGVALAVSAVWLHLLAGPLYGKLYIGHHVQQPPYCWYHYEDPACCWNS